MATVKATINGAASTVENIKDASGNVLATLTASVETETKSVTPSKTVQTVTPSTGKDGLSSVTVAAVTASVDSNIVASNIRSGVTILGVTGTYTGAVKTLSSISATYTGGDVESGTATADMTGLTVTAIYSDGSTEEVTGYTLSPDSIEDGENTITVTYGGLTCTFIVTGTSTSVTLDSVAFGSVTYRQLFMTDNNILNGADFENGLPTGWTISTGSPSITEDDSYSGTHSMEMSGTASQMYKYTPGSTIATGNTYFAAIKVNVTSFKSGSIGLNMSNHTLPYSSAATSGWVTKYVYKSNPSAISAVSIGSYSTAEHTAFLDDIVLVDLSAIFGSTIPTESEIVSIYNTYCDMRKSGAE